MLILDFGSGETFKNDFSLIKKGIDELCEAVGDYRNVVIKWQLFKQAKDGDNELLPLMPAVFDKAYNYAVEKGIMTTASVFDPESLFTLLKYKIPFVKFANNFALHDFSNVVPRGLPIYWSVGAIHWFTYLHDNYDNRPGKDVIMACVSKYPATIEEYERQFTVDVPTGKENGVVKMDACLRKAVSDHTVGWELAKKYKPMILEKHYKLEGMTHCQDCGAFAVTAKDIKELAVMK